MPLPDSAACTGLPGTDSRLEALHDVMLLQPPKYLYGNAAALIGRSSQQQQQPPPASRSTLMLHQPQLRFNLITCLHTKT
ncbi:uncharacterized protein V6R79_013842 [Siganus canaliculatus]